MAKSKLISRIGALALAAALACTSLISVSYTHLTLPTT